MLVPSDQYWCVRLGDVAEAALSFVLPSYTLEQAWRCGAPGRKELVASLAAARALPHQRPGRRGAEPPVRPVSIPCPLVGPEFDVGSGPI